MWPFSGNRTDYLEPSGSLAPTTLVEYVTPWLALLELYRKLGRRQEFEAVAYRVHFEFNIRYLRWGEDVAAVQPTSLEDYPHIIGRIMDTWGQSDCQAYLTSLVADNRGGLRVGFSPEVFSELLLLLDVLEVRHPGT